ncbi:polysaccharide pyruvyl transferase family protein [Butyrivibrio sp. AE2032]|uniref:polysaccharide pyruvyl transferase family protein n=1 Tax=Butyrivibrio sp. AE2032 TaxID=1458463 RepID=UPI00055696BB|nr:polysaccharide pyruvyl transferase family protein [Butyrivibrio sp. AE2032]
MSNIAVFDTSLGTLNLGDWIIMDAFYKEMDFLLKDSFVVRYGTHTPIAKSYQSIKTGYNFRYLNSTQYKFIGGTNIFKHSLLHANPDWNINFFDIKFYRNSISVGCGSYLESKGVDAYTRYLYKHILRKDIIHSTRDEKTKELLESLGFKAINTGCPTMWGFTIEHCESIPRTKMNNVVFTLTDYNKDYVLDQQMIDILLRCYDNVFFWPQGSDDLEYFNAMKNTNTIKVIKTNLQSYIDLLQTDIDYVGTRLHAGLFAISKKKRSIIISLDERAREIDKTYNLKCLERKIINDELESRINSSFETHIDVDLEHINMWKDQFR